MKKQRSFSVEFKRQVVGELLVGSVDWFSSVGDEMFSNAHYIATAIDVPLLFDDT